MNDHVTARKIAQVFKNGRSRAVRIPKDFDFEGDEVEIHKNSDGTLTLAPIGKKKTWADVFASMEDIGPEDSFPVIGDLLPEAVDLNWNEEA